MNGESKRRPWSCKSGPQGSPLGWLLPALSAPIANFLDNSVSVSFLLPGFQKGKVKLHDFRLQNPGGGEEGGGATRRGWCCSQTPLAPPPAWILFCWAGEGGGRGTVEHPITGQPAHPPGCIACKSVRLPAPPPPPPPPPLPALSCLGASTGTGFLCLVSFPLLCVWYRPVLLKGWFLEQQHWLHLGNY